MSGGAAAPAVFFTVPPEFPYVKVAHAVIAPLVFALFMPLGSIFIRLFTFRGVVWLHAGWMLFIYILSLAALGTGIWLAYHIDLLNSAHSIIGLVVICSCTVQPVTGIVHHLLYRNASKSNGATYLHRWWGRAIITLGAINGGLGLYLARSTERTAIIYGVGAGLVWVIWMGVIIMAFRKSRGTGIGKETFGTRAVKENSKRANSPQLPQSELF